MIIFIIAIMSVIGIIFFQLNSFRKTKDEIEELESFFPPISDIALNNCTISKDHLNDRIALRQIAKYPPSEKDETFMTENDINVSLISATGGSDDFNEAIIETNEYLCKNIGTSADLGVLQDICDKKLEVRENSIKSSLNLPLLIGLGGTFIGIIIGVIGFAFDLNSMFGTDEQSNNETNSLQFLLFGVGCAMIASLFGLSLTVYNTAFKYKNATAELDTERNEYFDFLRRELMPTLANSMSSSLNSLKSVLGHFVDKFGKNLDAYADSAELLNENLEKQHLVLTQIQELGVTRMTNRVTTAFAQLNDAAEALNTFHQYQQDLNVTISQVKTGVSQIDTLIAKFDNFISALNSVTNAQNSTIALQQQFKESIEQHFPTGAEGREIWRREFDNLLNDAQDVSKQLNAQLTQNTNYVQQFVSDNSRFFASFDEMQQVLASLVEYSKVQSECYKDLKDEILSLRKDNKDSQKETAELHKSLIEAVKAMTKVVKDLKD